jgi:transposase
LFITEKQVTKNAEKITFCNKTCFLEDADEIAAINIGLKYKIEKENV